MVWPRHSPGDSRRAAKYCSLLLLVILLGGFTWPTNAAGFDPAELQTVVDKIGVEPTGMPFNSIIAIELNEAGNSVRALRAIHYIGTRLETSLFMAQD